MCVRVLVCACVQVYVMFTIPRSEDYHLTSNVCSPSNMKRVLAI